MFPGADNGTIYRLRITQSWSKEDIIDYLLSTAASTDDLGSVESILSHHARNVMGTEDEHFLKTNRSCIWNKAKAFYKCALHNNSIMQRPIMVQFSGEEGVDAGALRNDFFEEALRQGNKHFFEGEDTRRVPRYHWGADVNLQIVGAMIAHSVIQRGPGFPCIHPALVNYMITKEVNMEALTPEMLPVKTDIPKDASTIDVIELIEKVWYIIVII